ncbi:MAG: type I methionyl aminopeptidase [Clostridiales bacterium]|jgi:methionyl aminopeptidase|nr:type I methionyl aminopeptidase [Clostridiales bacterium]
MGIFIKNDEQISYMRTAGKIAAKTHELLSKYIKPGVTTAELNAIAEEFILSNDAKPSFIGYRGFPSAICTSINNEVIHGVPGLRKLRSGDIISIDLGVCFKRFHGDAARTFAVGKISEKHQILIDVTEQSFFAGLKCCTEENRLHDISNAIDDYVKPFGFGIVSEWCGHGVGRQVHEDPQIPHTRQQKRGPRLQRGMTLAIEPMINIGTEEINMLDDTWTVTTRDGEYSAHYENTVLITDGEPEILTI